MHDDIKRFFLDGEIDSSNLIESKDRLVHFLESRMRGDGFVPALDMDPQFTRDYNPTTEKYDFKLSVYGIFVGKAKACETAGIMGGKTIQLSTPNPRLKQS